MEATYNTVNERYDELLRICEDFEAATIADIETLESETEFAKESWSNLNEKLSDLRRHMINVKTEMVTFDDLERKLEDLFDFLGDELGKQSFVSALPSKCEQHEKNIKVEIYCREF